MNDLIKRYKDTQGKLKELKELETHLKHEILHCMGRKSELSTDSYIVKLVKSDRESFKLKDALQVYKRADLLPFITFSTSKRLTIKTNFGG